jgi:integrase
MMFESAEIRALAKAATPVFRAMVYLGVNCGFNGSDIGRVPVTAIDRKTGWLRWFRKKTGFTRRAKLWPETVAAIQAAIPCRPKTHSEEFADRLFLTRTGQPWYRDDVRTHHSPLSTQFRVLMEAAGVYRPRRGFLALRHTAETIAGDTKDQVAVDVVMGHVDDSVPAMYRERLADERFVDVANFMHNWLFLPA